MHTMHRLGLPLPAERCKGQPQEGGGGRSGKATVLSHNVRLECVVPQRGGNAVRFFHFVFFVSGSVSFVVFCRSSPLRVVFFEKFSGANFCFWGGCVGLVFFGGFLLMFLLYFWYFAPETVWKNSLHVRSGFFLGLFSLP